jgi:hypothetical protein
MIAYSIVYNNDEYVSDDYSWSCGFAVEKITLSIGDDVLGSLLI